MGAGKIVVCIVNGKTFVKKLEMSQRRIRLLSANERYAPIEVARDDISFVGVVLGRMGAPRG
jgi:SOS-response transcriptional repressor LexA